MNAEEFYSGNNKPIIGLPIFTNPCLRQTQRDQFDQYVQNVHPQWVLNWFPWKGVMENLRVGAAFFFMVGRGVYFREYS